jgi:glutaredoxin
MTEATLAVTHDEKTAVLYRMVMPDHVCPYGLKTKHLLESRGYAVEDHHLKTRQETDDFKSKHGVKTTPQTFIGGERIGGHDAVREHFGLKVRKEGETTYQPVIAIFGMTAAMAVMAARVATGNWVSVLTFEWFIAFSMCALAIQKLQDVQRFSTMFLNYDLLARRWVPYGSIYPFAEGLAGVLMITGVLNWVSVPVALFIGGIGAVSVLKAVYVDKRELKCACVGGSSNVPLGFVSLTENLMMVAMAVWMAVRMGI